MAKKLLNKFNLILFFLTFVSFVFLFYKVSNVKAESVDAVPDPGRIPCTDTIFSEKNPEYASDRPYQASPCGDRPITYWCGNDVVINLGTVRTPYCDKQGGSETECPCKTNCVKDQKIDVSLTDVELPILGNTELTKNSTTAEDQMDDNTKVSNYVAWYLGGANDKAEYGTENNPATLEGISKIIDGAGPNKKLLPSVIQDVLRIQTIETASTKETYTKDPDEDNLLNPGPVTENQNHNQIVACAESSIPFIGDILGIGTLKPKDCYTGGGAKATGSIFRLRDWEGDLSFWNTVANGITGLVNAFVNLFPFIPNNIINESIGDHWNLAKPPLPWSDKDGKPFETSLLYRKAYNEWRGKTCVILPVIKLLFCAENVLVPNKYSDFYSYVPLANTIDKKGTHMVTNTHIEAPRATLENKYYVIQHSPQFYLAHSLENFQLSSYLKTTYKPKGGESSTATLPDVENNSQCRIIPSRTNPGDDTTFGNPESHMEVDVHYEVTMIQCVDIHWVEPTCVENGKCRGGYWDADCSSTIYATVNTTGKFAYNDEIWQNTVAGNDSIFRRIYPKTGANAPINCISDMPAVSNATYTLKQVSIDQGLELDRVVEPDKSAVKSEDGVVANAQLYYPHYGGVLEYFLNGIQQALRPQGYGPGQPENGTLCETSTTEEGDCSWNLAKINAGINKAAAKYKVPASLLKAIFEIESYEWINGAEQYKCEPNFAGAMGVAQITQATYDSVTCAKEKMEDKGMCDSYDPKLSRCNFEDAFELMARILLLKAGRWNANTCSSPSGINESETQVWYDAACNYYGSHSPDSLTIGLANDIPADKRRQNGDMNYCDIVGYKMGKFPPYP